ncbi:hypothetical protein LS71_002535 [Helicobacter jaachi]|uniref:Uncharacterized protein n=1 Tax=Helicobacter jaachi TaxID=1677920 RepID=A0A4U8TCG7_9HELI|nr:hypothetical protein [Helicobacter jaachi]TLD97639.1 hypothetical protein LS71_002535 [Helicobacter jaachi]
MALFQVNMPPLPENQFPIHYIHNTPTLRKAKRLWIASFIIMLIGMFAIGAMYGAFATMDMYDYTELKTPDMLGYIINFISTICMFFAYFYISKLALRARLFKLCIAQLVFSLIGTLCLSLVDTPYEPVGAQDWFVGLFCLIALPVLIYIFYQMNRELSFITDEKWFLKSTKMMLFGLVLLLIIGVGAIILATSVGASSVIAVILSLAFTATLIFIFVAIVMYIVAIFKLRLVIAYGQNVPNPL